MEFEDRRIRDRTRGCRRQGQRLQRDRRRDCRVCTQRAGAFLVAADGLVAPEFVWSALDCPTGFVRQYDRISPGGW